MKKILSIILILLLAQFVIAQTDLATHVYIQGLETASAPQYHPASDSMIFTYQELQMRFQPRHVGISFEHENFAVQHQMSYFDRRDEDGNLLSRVYFIFIPVQPLAGNMNEIHYRYVVDGIWIEDPLNPEYTQKISGRRLSVAHLPETRELLPSSPVVSSTNDQSRSRLVKFRFFGDPGQQVYLAGDFNNWDPFMYPMSELRENPGEYELTIRLLPGEYEYNYYYRGRRIKDPLNVRSRFDIEGYEYSAFSVDG